VRAVVSRILTGWDGVAEVAATADEALALVANHESLALAIVDELLPSPGLEVAAAIQRRRGGALPIIVASSFGRREAVAREAEQRGVMLAGQMSKPIKPASLAALASVAMGIALPATGEAATVGPTSDAEMAVRHPLRILVAEDNALNRRLAVRLLEQRGYAIDVANDGREAVEAVERTSYDLVLMDVQMPVMDGLEATRCIVERWQAAERPRIVAMTANATREDREACIMSGMDGYIAKPIHVPELVAELEATRRRATPGRPGA